MRKKRLLWVGEFTAMSSGYSTYGLELLRRLHDTGKYELMELASFAGPEDPRIGNLPWPVRPVRPHPDDKQGRAIHDSNPSNQWGEWRFDDVCLEFKPDVCIDIRDHWMCLTKDTPIMTESGPVPVQSVVVGDMVLTHKGRYRQVTKLFPERMHKGGFVRLKASNFAMPIVVTDDHPVLVHRRKSPSLPTEATVSLQWSKAGEVAKGDLVVFPCPPEQAISSDITVDEARLLGYYAAEGCVLYEGRKSDGVIKGVQFAFHANETSFVDDVVSLVSRLYGLRATVRRPGGGKAIVRLFSGAVGKRIASLVPGLAGDKRVPREIYGGSPEIAAQFLCGLFRGDGHREKRGDRGSYCTKSHQLATQVFTMCTRFGIVPSMSLCNNRLKGKRFYKYAFCFCDEAFRGFMSIWDGDVPDVSCRRIMSGLTYLTVKEVTRFDGEAPVYNFEVDEDNSYVSYFALHNCEFIERSPFRPYFHFAHMPTVDGDPQQREWLSTYMGCDSIFTYSDWGMDQLRKQTGDILPLVDSAPPGADLDSFTMVKDRAAHRDRMGLTPDIFIVGTVMRNQRRKLYPDLFEAFRLFLDAAPPDLAGKTYLHVHTHWPDLAWDIPQLLLETGLSSRCLFTYFCTKCSAVYPAFFQETRTVCKRCGQREARLPNSGAGISRQALGAIYGLWDAHVQYSVCFPPGTDIHAETGWKPIDEIVAGEKVWTGEQRLRAVNKVMRRNYSGNLKRVRCWNEETRVEATPEHPFLTLKASHLREGEIRSPKETITRLIDQGKPLPPPVFVPVSELQKGDFLVFPIDDTVEDVLPIDLSAYLTPQDYVEQQFVYVRNGKRLPRFHDIDENFCRLIGLFAADGSTGGSGEVGGSATLTLGVDETDLHEFAVAAMAKLQGEPPGFYKYKDRKAVSISAFGAPICRLLRSLCGIGQTKQVPPWSLRLPPEKQKQVLRGLFEGDGHYDATRDISIFTTTSPVLANQVKTMLRRLRVRFSSAIAKKSGKRFHQARFEVGGDVSKLEFTGRSRKSSSFYHGSNFYLQIREIEDVPYDGPVFNVEVEDDHTYVVKTGVVHNCEGFGMPMVEAASCGVPVFAVDYSAMSDVVRKLKGFPIPVERFMREMETHRRLALPDNAAFAKLLQTFLLMPEPIRRKHGWDARRAVEQHYTWEKTAQKWMDRIDSLDLPEHDQTWLSPRKRHEPITQVPQGLSEADFVHWGLIHVANRPDLARSYQALRMARDLQWGCTVENHGRPTTKPFRREHAMNFFLDLCERRNRWEARRS